MRPSGRTLDENVFKQFVMERTDSSNASLLLDRDYNLIGVARAVD